MFFVFCFFFADMPILVIVDIFLCKMPKSADTPILLKMCQYADIADADINISTPLQNTLWPYSNYMITVRSISFRISLFFVVGLSPFRLTWHKVIWQKPQPPLEAVLVKVRTECQYFDINIDNQGIFWVFIGVRWQY